MTIKRLSPVVLCCVVGCLSGCQSSVKNRGTWGFRWGTDIALYSDSAQTAPEPATSEIRSQPLEEWMKGKQQATPPPVAVEPGK